MKEDMWDSGLYETIIEPIAEKALQSYGDKIRKEKSLVVDIDKCSVELINNPIIHNEFFRVMWPKYADTECQVNIQVTMKKRTYVIIYQYINGKWIKDQS